MRIHEQRDRLIDAVRAAEDELRAMRSAVLRKIASPYGDGSRSDMVNATTDVVPRLQAVLDLLTVATDDVGGSVQPAGHGGGPGYPGPCPEGMDWSRWLAMNNVD